MWTPQTDQCMVLLYQCQPQVIVVPCKWAASVLTYPEIVPLSALIACNARN